MAYQNGNNQRRQVVPSNGNNGMMQQGPPTRLTNNLMPDGLLYNGNHHGNVRPIDGLRSRMQESGFANGNGFETSELPSMMSMQPQQVSSYFADRSTSSPLQPNRYHPHPDLQLMDSDHQQQNSEFKLPNGNRWGTSMANNGSLRGLNNPYPNPNNHMYQEQLPNHVSMSSMIPTMNGGNNGNGNDSLNGRQNYQNGYQTNQNSQNGQNNSGLLRSSMNVTDNDAEDSAADDDSDLEP